MNEKECFEIVKKLRWPNGISCPRCMTERVTVYEKRTEPPGKYECLVCKRTFTELSGTVFANSKLPLSKWFECIKLISNGGSHITLHLAKELEVSWNTGNKLLNKLESELTQGNELIRNIQCMI